MLNLKEKGRVLRDCELNTSEGEGDKYFLSLLFFTSNFTMSHPSENSRPATMEERMVEMFTQLNIQITNMATRMDSLEQGGNHNLAWCQTIQEEIGSYGDNVGDRRECRKKRKDGDPSSIKMQILSF